MRTLIVSLVLAATLVAIHGYGSGKLPTTSGEGCPDGHSPGDKFDKKPGCSQCICYRNAEDGHFCRACGKTPSWEIPGFKREYDNTKPYPSCCYPKYVRT